MPFFESPPPPPDPPRQRPPKPRWLGPPDGVIGQVAPVQAVLVRSEAVLMVADRFVCYPSGFEFHLSVRMSRAFPGPMMMMIGGPQVTRAGSSRGDADDALRFGIAFADGRKATNLDPRPWGPGSCGVASAATASQQSSQAPPEPESPLLTAHGGAGSDSRWDQNCWIWGLPPDGPMGVVIEWRAEGIEETCVEVDSALIREATSRAETVWES